MNQRLNIAGRLGKAAMHSAVTPIAAVLIFFLGLTALWLTPREENPQIDVPAANVLVAMPGAGPEEVLNLIVRPLEMVLQEMTEVDHTYGTARDSLGVVNVMFEVGADKETSLVKLYDRVMHNLDRIPPGAGQPMIKPVDVDDVPILAITFSSAAYSDIDLKRLAERVKEQITPLRGISVAEIIGGRDRRITVELDPGRLSAYGIPLNQLYERLRGANFEQPIGHAVDRNQLKLIRLDGALHSAADVARIVIHSQDGRPVYLEDVADILEASAEYEHLHRIGFGAAPLGEARPAETEAELPAVTLTLAKKHGTNAVNLADQALRKLQTLRGDLIPDDVTVTISRNSGEQASSAVNTLIEHLGIAIVSVVLILLIFLGWREATIVTLNIPLILFVVLAIGLLAGQTINRITLFSLILALGLLVDDAIVVIENIHRHLSSGLGDTAEKARRIIVATNETGRPTIIATFAVILAFIPMAFVTGMMGPYMGPIPFNTPIAMLASLIIAYLFTPWIAQRWLPAGHATPDPGPARQDLLQRWYTALVVPMIERRGWQIGFTLLVGALLAVTLWQPLWQFFRPAGLNAPLASGAVALKMLPKGNKDTFNITIDMPEGTPLEMTDRVSRDIGELLARHPRVTDYQTYVGIPGPVDFNGMLRGAVLKRGSEIAEIRVNLVDRHRRPETSEQIVLGLRQSLAPIARRYPTAGIKLVEDPPGPPVRATLLAELYGPDYETARALAREIHSQFRMTANLTDIDDSVTADQIEYRVTVDKEKAALAGVATDQIAQLLRDFVSGFDLGRLHTSNERNPVMIQIRLPRRFRISPRDLERLFVSTDHGDQIPIAAVARVEERIAAKPIHTKDGFPVVYVSAEPQRGSQVYPLLELDRRLDGRSLLPDTPVTTGGLGLMRTQPEPAFGYQLLWDGEMRLTLDVFRDLGSAFIVAIVLIYLLLAAYYANFVLPLIVMGAIPLTVIGVFPGHLLTQQPFTATSMIGMIALAGIVVRNSLLLIDFILEQRQQGVVLRDAVVTAGTMRVRPIMLTALAVIAGSAIMITDPVFGGLGVSLAFGTLASTVLTLFLIPLLYYRWQRDKQQAQPQPTPIEGGLS